MCTLYLTLRLEIATRTCCKLGALLVTTSQEVVVISTPKMMESNGFDAKLIHEQDCGLQLVDSSKTCLSCPYSTLECSLRKFKASNTSKSVTSVLWIISRLLQVQSHPKVMSTVVDEFWRWSKFLIYIRTPNKRECSILRTERHFGLSLHLVFLFRKTSTLESVSSTEAGQIQV